MILMEAIMEQFVGLDVSQELTHLCVIGNDGKTVWQGKCCSTPDDIAATIRSKSQGVVRIGLESGPLSTWHWHALKAMGLPALLRTAIAGPTWGAAASDAMMWRVRPDHGENAGAGKSELSVLSY
jgi:hypothetical protein